MATTERRGKHQGKYHGKPCGKCGATLRYKGGPCVACQKTNRNVYRRARVGRGKIQGNPCVRCGGTERYAGSLVCVPCHKKYVAARKLTPEVKYQIRKSWYRTKYGVTPEFFDQLLESQGRRCAICETSEPMFKPGGHRSGTGWCLDHDHATNEIRGVLCSSCNYAIGMLGDSIPRLHQAIRYLSKTAKVQEVS